MVGELLKIRSENRFFLVIFAIVVITLVFLGFAALFQRSTSEPQTKLNTPCELADGSCDVLLAGQSYSIRVTPFPLAETEHQITLATKNGAPSYSQAKLKMEGLNMYMGEPVFSLQKEQNGFSGNFIIPQCTMSEHMDWRFTLELSGVNTPDVSVVFHARVP